MDIGIYGTPLSSGVTEHENPADEGRSKDFTS